MDVGVVCSGSLCGYGVSAGVGLGAAWVRVW